MLMVQHKAPHREWAPGPAHVADFAHAEIPEPATLLDDYANRSDAARQATMRISQDMRLVQDLKVFAPDSQYGQRFLGLMDEDAKSRWIAAYAAENAAFQAVNLKGDDLVRWKYQRYIKDYLRCIQSVDDGVGRLLDYLEVSGLEENTVVVYSSDQGFYLGEHGWFDKRFMYEESLRTPLLVRWPGVTEQGNVESRIVSNLDLAETFLDIAGEEIPEDMQGRSLVPLLRGELPSDWRQSFYYHYYEGPPAVHTVAQHYGVTDGRYKLIHFYQLGQWELFDLETDPHELRSVYNEAEFAEVQTRLTNELGRLREELLVESNEPH
jgi:arylsulfatase A-like enzyme